MKSFVVFAILVAGAVAQSLSILHPTSGASITEGTPFVIELHQDQSATDAHQVNIAMALTSCGGGLCPDDPSQWPMGQVIYNGPFNPQADPSRPQLGLVEDFLLEVPEGLPAGDAVLSVYHLEDIGVAGTPYMEFKTVHLNVSSLS